ncbi:MAG: sigma-70 family RNA polymerase sigma factor [Terriglobia bacterium]
MRIDATGDLAFLVSLTSPRRECHSGYLEGAFSGKRISPASRNIRGMTFEEFFSAARPKLDELYQSSGAARWSVSIEEFGQAAWKGVGAAAQIEPAEIPRLLSGLRAEDLALALGCARGDEKAWDTFCAQYRSALYEAAHAVAHEETTARELADSLLAELYGLDSAAPGRNSRFAYFHGRSSLKTWLRAVLYQEFVDEYRRQSRLAPLPDDPGEIAAGEASAGEQDDQRYAACLGEAVEAALAELPVPEKLLLSYYYVQGLTLKQIGLLTGEHEATISRHLETTRKKLRKRIEAFLRQERKLSAFEVDRCLDFAARGVLMDMERALRPK